MKTGNNILSLVKLFPNYYLGAAYEFLILMHPNTISMTNKALELNTTVKLVNNKLHFMGKAGDNAPVSIDYIAPLGDDSGYTSLELLLLSFSSCLGSAVLTFLRKMNKTITGCEIIAKGFRHEDHPTGFKSISVVIRVNSPDVSEADLQKVTSLAEDKYCPVWAMIKGNTVVNTAFEIIKQP